MTEKKNSSTSSEKVQISIGDILLEFTNWMKYIRSKWAIIAFFIILGGSIGFFYAYAKKPIYTAATTFVLEDEKGSSGLGGLAGLASVTGIDLGSAGGGIFQGDNIINLYKSRKMLQQTLLTPVTINQKEKLLIDRYISYNGLTKKWAKNNKSLKINFLPDSLVAGVSFLRTNRLRDSILGSIVDDLERNYVNIYRPDKKLNMIKVEITANDEVFAKVFNDELVKKVNQFYIDTKTKKTLQNITILQHKTDSVRAVMNGAIYTTVAVADATPNLNPMRQVKRLVPIQRAQFSAEANKAVLTEMTKNLELTKLTLLRETPLIQVIDNPVLPLSKKTFGKIIYTVIFSMLAAILGVVIVSLRFFYIKLVKV